MCRPNHEAIAGYNLSRQGFVNYVPCFGTKQGTKTRVRPLFPRYIFIFIDQFWHSILGTRGISRILLNGDGPAVLSEIIILELRKREVKGLVQLVAPPKFVQGEKVKVLEGPLSGHTLIYDGMLPHERVRVLMDLLGRAVPVELDERVLIAA